MKTAIILLAVIVIVGVAFGSYLGWFSFSSRNDAGKPEVTLSMDKDKIEADKDKVVDKAQDLVHKAVDQIEATTQKAQD